jgi:hypothetical protein
MRTLKNSRGGFATVTGPYGEVVEMDTATCGHCQRIIFFKPKPAPAPGGVCMICYTIICDECVDKGKCEPFEKQLEEEEKQDYARRNRGY